MVYKYTIPGCNHKLSCTVYCTIKFVRYICTMITTYSDFRQKLKSYLDEVFKSNVPLFVTRTKGENIVVMSESDYESIMETFHLLKSPKNAKRLQRAIDQYQRGEGKVKVLIEE